MRHEWIDPWGAQQEVTAEGSLERPIEIRANLRGYSDLHPEQVLAAEILRLAAAEALIADWLERQAKAELAKAGLSSTTSERLGNYHGARALALREAAEAVRHGRARREGGAAEGGGRPEYQPPPPPSRAVGNASAAELAGLSPMGRLEAHAAADERARIRQMALDLAEEWETAEGDDVPNTKADLEWKAEGVRDFAALLETRP